MSRLEELNEQMKQTKMQLQGERDKEPKDQMPLVTAYYELQEKVLSNDIRKLNGLPPVYSTGTY